MRTVCQWRALIVSEPCMRRQVWLTALCWAGLGVSIFAASDEATLHPSGLFTWQNILTAGVLLYHFGMLREQFKTVQKRVDDLEQWKTDEINRRLKALEGRQA